MVLSDAPRGDSLQGQGRSTSIPGRRTHGQTSPQPQEAVLHVTRRCHTQGQCDDTITPQDGRSDYARGDAPLIA